MEIPRGTFGVTKTTSQLGSRWDCVSLDSLIVRMGMKPITLTFEEYDQTRRVDLPTEAEKRVDSMGEADFGETLTSLTFPDTRLHCNEKDTAVAVKTSF